MKRVFIFFFTLVTIPAIFANSPIDLLRTGDSLLLIKKSNEAIAKYTEALTIDSLKQQALYRLGVAYGIANKYDKALGYIRQASELRFGADTSKVKRDTIKISDYNLIERMARLGDACVNQGKYETAKDFYRYAMQCGGSNQLKFVYNETKSIVRSAREGWRPVRNSDGSIMHDKAGKIYFYTDPKCYDSDLPSEIKDSAKWSEVSKTDPVIRQLKDGRLQVWVLSYRPEREVNENGLEELGPDGEYYLVFPSLKELMQFDYGVKEYRTLETYKYDGFGKVKSSMKDPGAEWNHIIPGSIAEKLYRGLERVRP